MTVAETLPFGFLLRNQHGDEAILKHDDPQHADIAPDDEIEVVIYEDKQGQNCASLTPPKVLCDNTAALTVTGVSKHGAFVDWGIEQDLFVPIAQQDRLMQVGLTYVVHVYYDDKYQKLQGSTKLHRFYPETDAYLKSGDAVTLLVTAKSELGFKVLIENRCLGLIFKSDVFMPIKPGQSLTGFIKQVREDGKLDVALQRDDETGRSSLHEQIIEDLLAHGGVSTLTDKSPADEINRRFGVSKGAYKKALGALFKQRRIIINKEFIKLISEEMQ